MGGDFKLGDVGRALADSDERMIHERRKAYKKKAGCCHELMTEGRPGCLVGCFQLFVKCAYCCCLPCGVKALKFHKHEKIHGLPMKSLQYQGISDVRPEAKPM